MHNMHNRIVKWLAILTIGQLRNRENSDVFNRLNEIYLVFISKSKYPLYICVDIFWNIRNILIMKEFGERLIKTSLNPNNLPLVIVSCSITGLCRNMSHHLLGICTTAGESHIG